MSGRSTNEHKNDKNHTNRQIHTKSKVRKKRKDRKDMNYAYGFIISSNNFTLLTHIEKCKNGSVRFYRHEIVRVISFLRE